MVRSVFLLSALAFCGCPLPPGRGPEGNEDAEAAATQVTHGRAGEDKDPDVSPDGRRLFYASSAFGDHMDLFMREIGSNVATQLTALPGDERFPRVNPADPKMLAFSSNSRGDWDIYVMPDYEGRPKEMTIVSEPGTEDLHPSWSPDGRKLVYSAGDSQGRWTLRVKDLATGRTTVLEDVEGLLPEWSPRGDRIAFQRMRGRDGWFGSIWTLELTEGSARNLTAVFASEDWAAINPAWSPDGRYLVFATVGKSRARAGMLHEADDLWIVGADGTRAAHLTSAPAADGMPTWASDGRVYFVSNRSGVPRIWAVTPTLP